MNNKNPRTILPASKVALREAVTEQLMQKSELHKQMGGKVSERIRRSPFYDKATCVFVSPHPLLHQSCLNLLSDQKLLILPSPRLQKGFYALSSQIIPVRHRQAALSRLGGKNPLAPKIDYTQGPGKKINLLLTAPLTAGVDGSMLSDGHGHFDIQYAILDSLGWLAADAVTVAILADDRFLQSSPLEPTDILAHHVITPTQTLQTCHVGRQKPEISWHGLEAKQVRRNDALFFLKKSLQIF